MHNSISLLHILNLVSIFFFFFKFPFLIKLSDFYKVCILIYFFSIFFIYTSWIFGSKVLGQLGSKKGVWVRAQKSKARVGMDLSTSRQLEMGACDRIIWGRLRYAMVRVQVLIPTRRVCMRACAGGMAHIKLGPRKSIKPLVFSSFHKYIYMYKIMTPCS